MLLQTPLGSYRWIENWITIPESPLGKTNGRTHGAAVARDGRIIIFHQADPAILLYSPEGELLASWGSFPGAHGLTLVEEDGEEFLWLTDQDHCSVVKATLAGEIVQTLPKPLHPLYTERKYVPTWAAVNERRFGGNGEIWVADGYGASLVHCFSEAGELLQTFDGSEGAGRFACPHGISLDTRGSEPEIAVADRGNKRFQIFGTDGTYRRSFGAEFLTSPDVGVMMGEYLVVPELVARLSILDSDNKLAAQFGENDSVSSQEGWPNNREWVVPGRFNSPHGAAADAQGNIYVVEWITGGRVTKLERVS